MVVEVRTGRRCENHSDEAQTREYAHGDDLLLWRERIEACIHGTIPAEGGIHRHFEPGKEAPAGGSYDFLGEKGDSSPNTTKFHATRMSPGRLNNPPPGPNCFRLGVFLKEKWEPSMSDEGSQRRGRRSFLVLGLFILIGLAGSMAWLLRLPKFAGPPVPKPNGYDTLLAAGRLVTGVAPAQGMADKATEGELRAFVAVNQQALALAQAGFSQESVVPLGRMESIGAALEGSGPFRQLGGVLTCQAVLAARGGSPKRCRRAWASSGSRTLSRTAGCSWTS